MSTHYFTVVISEYDKEPYVDLFTAPAEATYNELAYYYLDHHPDLIRRDCWVEELNAGNCEEGNQGSLVLTISDDADLITFRLGSQYCSDLYSQD